MINLFVPITDYHGDLTNWIILIITMSILIPIPVLLGSIISKYIANEGEELMTTFFEINHFLDNKKTLVEKTKLSSVYNIMKMELDGSFIKQCRNNSPNPLGELEIYHYIFKRYKEKMEEYYEYLLGFNEKNASKIRITIKNILKRLEKLRVDNNYYYIKDFDCHIFILYHDIIDDICKKHFESVKGVSVSVPVKFRKYLDL